MMAAGDMLKPTEAAVVASTDLREVNRAFDEHILPEGLFSAVDGRRVMAAACSLISFYVEARDLTAEARISAIQAAGVRMRSCRTMAMSDLLEGDWTFRPSGFLTVDLGPFLHATRERMDRLQAARDMVESTPDVLAGTPVLRGTRIPVRDVAASVAAGIPASRILSAYTELDEGIVDLARLWAEANPPRGRPRATRDLPKGAVVVSDRRVPRRGAAG